MIWKQISFEVKKSETDLVSEVLMGLGSVSITYSDALDDAIYEPPVGQTPLWDNVKVNALFSSEVNQKSIETSISDICNIVVIDTVTLKDRVWEEECQKDFPSMRFGKRLWVCPSWDTESILSNDSIVIHMDPGLAFGTGTHQTTSLCLEYLDSNPPKNLHVIDFGCGTGILAIAAAKFGAKSVIAIDNDPQAVLSSKENVAKNKCENTITTIHSINQGNDRKCDLLIANILANPLVELEPLFSDLVHTNGMLLLSGILKEQVDRVVKCYSINFSNIEVANKGEWFRISGKRK
ncbi:MAG: 50S ribosomal protein L11 methyltransferase [Gammaproteobacteria bacterium]|jgi:ribosomal protein L11 methyltransferase|nr:50S ribosomal protein L11 methyltransferase [Gammaproteobacteria bacterium]MBT4245688.1 50S ribosomal protein L11 methyltransferase [Gammaproteobacteria bacterium]|tara:strand:+ start:335 stop:1213 length:879 start_codon:yes stop_codon:yes gene_type:complete